MHDWERAYLEHADAAGIDRARELMRHFDRERLGVIHGADTEVAVLPRLEGSSGPTHDA